MRLALVGLGWWTREEAIPAIRAAELCEATVAVSGDRGKAERVANEEGTVEAGITYEAFHDGAAADAYDAVYVCTPNALHREYVETAAGLGKAVLCEKPVEASRERAEGLVAAAGAAGVTLMVAYRMHTEPAVRRLRELVADGLIGEPVAVFGHMTQPLLDRIPDPDQWRLDPELAGPGASVTDLGIYPINTARFVLGADPVAVQAAMDTDGGAFGDVPDERAAFTLRFPGGVLAACGASQNAAMSSQLRVIGTGGEAVLEPAFFPSRPRELALSRGGTTVETSFEGVDQMTEEFDYFADCVLAGRTPEADGEHALVDVRTIEAVYEAAERGRQVEL